MLTVYHLGAIGKYLVYLGNTMHDASPCKIVHVNSLTSTAVYPSRARGPSNNVLHNSSFTWKGLSSSTHHVASKRWLCQSQGSMSPDDEYRSSRNIAISLFRRYRKAVNRGGGDNLKEFISAGVNAYALGCTEEGLRKELIVLKESGVEIEPMQSYGGSTSLKSKIFSQELSDECILWLSIIFITILCTPQPTIVRWSSTSPVSNEILLQWKGFCALIANAYYVRGMAWLPVKTLQLEQMAVMGRAEEPSVVASRMQLVFSTLEVSKLCNSYLINDR
ncbi:LOW QUALITY PROTEIN: hypothetical protein CFOL_v3_33631, partial [Cephalotus follicularis]